MTDGYRQATPNGDPNNPFRTKKGDKYIMDILTDGSWKENQIAGGQRIVPAGWGFVARDEEGATLTERYGPVITLFGKYRFPGDRRYIGAIRG